MALVDEHGNPVAAPAPVPAHAATAGQPLIDVNQLRTAFGNPELTFPSSMETLHWTMLVLNSCWTESESHVPCMDGQMKLQLETSN